MTLATLGLVLASAVIHATWNLWTKQLATAHRGALMWLLVTLSSLIYVGPALWMVRASGWRPDAAALLLVGGSGVIHVVYFLALLAGYRHGDLSVVYPLARGSGPLLAALAALPLFGEAATPGTLAGIACIGAGVFVLSGRPAGVDDAKLAPALRWGLVTGVLIAAYTLWDGWSVKRAGVPPLVFYWCGELVRVVLFTPAALGARAEVAALWRTQRARVLGIAALSPLSYILVLIAMRMGALSHVAPAREISILIGAWLGGAVLGERARRRRLVAAGLFVSGLLSLAFARG